MATPGKSTQSQSQSKSVAVQKARSRGIVRPGQKKPFRKSTPEELEERIEFVVSIFRNGPVHKSKLKAAIKKQFDVDARTAEEYISRGKQVLLARIEETKDVLRSESAAFYEGMMLNSDASPAEKLKACSLRDNLLGLGVAPRDRIGLEFPTGPQPEKTGARRKVVIILPSNGREMPEDDD